MSPQIEWTLEALQIQGSGMFDQKESHTKTKKIHTKSTYSQGFLMISLRHLEKN